MLQIAPVITAWQQDDCAGCAASKVDQASYTFITSLLTVYAMTHSPIRCAAHGDNTHMPTAKTEPLCFIALSRALQQRG
jgi:hypothetical protein